MTRTDLLKMFRFMLLERRYEEKTIELKRDGEELSLHSSIGYEAVNVGAAYALKTDDYVKLHYRNRGVWFVLGLTPRTMMAELLAKEASTSKGKGNYLHPVTKNTIQRTGVIGSSMPISSGAALAIKMRKKRQIVLCCFGEGSVHEGDWHEAVNFAAVWNLPILFLCLNNEIVYTTPFSETVLGNIASRFRAYGINGTQIDGVDPVVVYKAVQREIRKVREGDGPRFIECNVPRLRSHYEGFPETRTKKEMEKVRKKDPVKLFKERLMKSKILTEQMFQEINNEVRAEIDDAVQFAQKCPYSNAEELFTDVYAPSGITEPIVDENRLIEGRAITFAEALREALVEEMRRDEKVFILGHDVRYGTVGGVTRGLAEEFGRERVRNTTISESGIIGVSVGAALLGYRPVAEVSSGDWMALAMDQVTNSAAKMRYSYGGKASVPMVVRIQAGAALNCPMYHCQSLEAWYTHIPGIKVVYPSTPCDAKGLLKTSIRDGNPVIFLEHRLLYNLKGPLFENEYLIPLGKGKVKRTGEDVTVVAYGYHVHEALAAAEQLEKEAISVEVVDPRTLQPLDIGLILSSVKKTGRLVVVHESQKTGGTGAEIASLISEECFANLKAPIKRLGAPFTPTPFSPGLRNSWLSFMDRNAIKQACKQATSYKQ